jgi:hypothetical protein
MSITSESDWNRVESMARAAAVAPPSPREMMRMSAAAYRESAAMWLDTARLCQEPGARAAALDNCSRALFLAQCYERVIGAERRKGRL